RKQTVSNGEVEPASELELLLSEYEAGDLVPADVQLGPLSESATSDMRSVAEDMRRLMGLRRASCDPRPLPYSYRFCAKRMGWGQNRWRVERAIRGLVAAEVIYPAEPLERRGKLRGTATY